jgi:hypothetical protein
MEPCAPVGSRLRERFARRVRFHVCRSKSVRPQAAPTACSARWVRALRERFARRVRFHVCRSKSVRPQAAPTTDRIHRAKIRYQTERRASIAFLISPIALAGFNPFGQVLAQFMMVWQR